MKRPLSLIVLLFFFGQLSAQKLSTLFSKNASKFEKWEATLQTGDTESLLADCQSIVTTKENSLDAAFAMTMMGEVNLMDDMTDEAMEYFEKALPIFEQNKVYEGIGTCLYKIGNIKGGYGENEEGIVAFDKAIGFSERRNLPDLKYYSLRGKSNLLLDKPKEMTEVLKLLVELADWTREPAKQKESYKLIFDHYKSNVNLNPAIYFADKLQPLLEDAYEKVEVLRALGDIYRQQRKYKLAERQLEEAMTLATKKDDFSNQMTIATELCEVAIAQQNWAKATKNSQKAVQLAEQEEVLDLRAKNYRYLGFIDEQDGKIESALSHYEEALNYYESVEHPEVADIKISLGQLHDGKGETKKAHQYISEAIAAKENNIEDLSLVNAKLLLSQLELKLGNYERASELLEANSSVAKKMNNLYMLRSITSDVPNAFAQQEGYLAASQFSDQYEILADSSNMLDKSDAIYNLKLEYDIEKNKRRLAESESQRLEQESELQSKNFMVWLFGAGGLLALILGVFRYYATKKNTQLNKQRIQFLEQDQKARELELDVMRKEQESKRLRSMIEGEEKERRRVGQELHDGLGALLASVKMRISAIQNDLPQISAQISYVKAEELIDEACHTVREISHNMKPGVLDHYGLEYAINQMCETIAHSKKIDVNFIPFGLKQPLDDMVIVTIFRIVQELLKNIVVHADASEVIVQLTIEDGNINLTVEDDGKGFDVSQVKARPGIGMSNIKSRVGFLNGSLDIDSKPGEGSTFTIDIPYGNEELAASQQPLIA